METLSDDLIETIVGRLSSATAHRLSRVQRSGRVSYIAKHVLFSRHWASARVYAEAMRLVVHPSTQYAYKFAIRHALSNESVDCRESRADCARRCTKITKSGRRCLRTSTRGMTCCWQHS